MCRVQITSDFGEVQYDALHEMKHTFSDIEGILVTMDDIFCVISKISNRKRNTTLKI